MVSISICFLHLVMHISVSCKSVFYYISYNIQKEGYLEWIAIGRYQRHNEEKNSHLEYLCFIYIWSYQLYLYRSDIEWSSWNIFVGIVYLLVGYSVINVRTDGWKIYLGVVSVLIVLSQKSFLSEMENGSRFWSLTQTLFATKPLPEAVVTYCKIDKGKKLAFLSIFQAFGNVVCKLSAISFWPRNAKSIWWK